MKLFRIGVILCAIVFSLSDAWPTSFSHHQQHSLNVRLMKDSSSLSSVLHFNRNQSGNKQYNRLHLRTGDGDDGDYLENNNIKDDFDESFGDRVERKLNDRFPSSKKGKGSRRIKTKSDNEESGLPSLYGLNRWEILNRAVVAGVFVAGIGTGITIDSAINTNPKDLASRDAIDRNAPNPKLCATYGSSAMVIAC